MSFVSEGTAVELLGVTLAVGTTVAIKGVAVDVDLTGAATVVTGVALAVVVTVDAIAAVVDVAGLEVAGAGLEVVTAGVDVTALEVATTVVTAAVTVVIAGADAEDTAASLDTPGGPSEDNSSFFFTSALYPLSISARRPSMRVFDFVLIVRKKRIQMKICTDGSDHNNAREFTSIKV